MPTIKDSVFTEVALRRNAIDPERLRQARETQNELQKFGITKSIAMVILDKGLASKDVVRGIAEEADSLWIRCPACKEPSPLAQVDRHGRLKCQSCEQGIDYTSERIPEEDLAVSLRPSNERRRKEKKPPAGTIKKPDRDVVPEAAQAGGQGRQERRRPGPAGNASDGQASPREGGGAAPLLLDQAHVSDITKFKVRGIIAASTSGRLYRIDGAGEFGVLKLLDGALGSDKAQLKKWITTMQAIQDLPRTASLKPAEFHREGTAAYIVRPYLAEAKSLRAALVARSEEVRGPEAAIRIAGAILDSLSYFHSSNLAHGNLKPENVLLTGEGACMSDPGLVILLQGLSTEERALRLWESCRYHAPEVLQGEEPTPASDVYSVGRMLEEVLDALDGAEQSSDGAAWLRSLAGRMTAEDAVARYSSAKDVLWDFKARGASRKTGRDVKPASGDRQRIPVRPVAPRGRSRLTRLAGPVVLSAVLVALAGQAVTWYSARKAMASPHRAEEVSSRLIEAQVRELARGTRELETAEAEKRWRELADMFRGTSWEQRIHEASRGPLEEISRRRKKELSEAISRALSLAEEKQWGEAARCLLALGEDSRGSSEAREALRRISDGLFEEEGMVLVTRGAVASSGGKPSATGPFLIDAGLITKASREAIRSRKPAPGEDGETSPPAAGVSFDEAKSIAATLGKRLPSANEWDRVAALARNPSGDEEVSAKRIRDLEALFQWVEDEGEDDLSRAGYGWCRGGARRGIPLTHPARRKKAAGHPDVGVRFVRDL